jgi:hypothetical protein
MEKSTSGAAKKKKMEDLVQVPMRWPRELVTWVDAYADKNYSNRTAWVIQLINAKKLEVETMTRSSV